MRKFCSGPDRVGNEECTRPECALWAPASPTPLCHREHTYFGLGAPSGFSILFSRDLPPEPVPYGGENPRLTFSVAIKYFLQVFLLEWHFSMTSDPSPNVVQRPGGGEQKLPQLYSYLLVPSRRSSATRREGAPVGEGAGGGSHLFSSLHLPPALASGLDHCASCLPAFTGL